MGFIDNLRMSSLFPTGIRPPRRYVEEEEPRPTHSNPNEEIVTAINRIKLQQLIRENAIANATRNKPQQMNVVLGTGNQPLTPFQRESLALRDRGLDINELRTRGNLDLGRERIDLQADRNRGFDDRTAIQKQRADIYAFKAKNPNLRFDFSGPTVKIANPLTGEIEDTGIATGNLTDEDRINLGQTNALERLELSNQARAALEATRQANRIAAQTNQSGLRSDEIRLRDELNDEDNPSQTKTRNYNNAKELAARYPWLIQNKHLEFDDASGTFKVNQGSLDDTKYNDLLDKIYGTKTEPLPTNTTKPNTTQSTTTKPTNDNNPEVIKRNQAIEILKKNGKPVTENNIKFVMGQIK